MEGEVEELVPQAPPPCHSLFTASQPSYQTHE